MSTKGAADVNADPYQAPQDPCLTNAVMCPVCSMPAEHIQHHHSSQIWLTCGRGSLIHSDSEGHTDYYHHNYSLGGARMPTIQERQE